MLNYQALDLQKHLSLASLTQPCVMLQKFLIMKKKVKSLQRMHYSLDWISAVYAHMQMFSYFIDIVANLFVVKIFVKGQHGEVETQ